MSGITTHSQAGRNYLIFSVFKLDKHDFINYGNHRAVKEALEHANIPFKELTGSYEGETERSFLIPNNGNNLAMVKLLCKEHKQDCYLKLENHKHGLYKAYFVDNNDKQSFQGYFRSMDKKTIQALNLDYSYANDNPNTWFTIWHSDETRLDAHAHEINELADEKIA